MDVTIVGGGLAGCEAAWQLARAGCTVELWEMRPSRRSEAHQTDCLAELVCSNSFRSNNPHNAVGLLKEEMRALGSLILWAAEKHAVPAGDALAMDRHLFSEEVARHVENHPRIRVVRQEVERLDPHRPTLVATGPLTASTLATQLRELTGQDRLYFYDAIAPIVDADSIDTSVVFAQSRYDKGEGADYLNCPMNEEEYRRFVQALLDGEKVAPAPFEKEKYFTGCQPVEVIAESGPLSLAFGPMKPVGLIDPRTGRQPYAVVQLRKENRAGTAYNLVGFQTKLKYPEQKRVFSLIPGLERAEFLRLGSVHRNTYLHGPSLLDPTLALRSTPMLRFAGQITGVEGYVESTACGLLAAMFWVAQLRSVPAAEISPPRETAHGAMLHHITASESPDYQPSNINFSLFSPLVGRFRKTDKKSAYRARALEALGGWVPRVEALLGPSPLPTLVPRGPGREDDPIELAVTASGVNA